MTPTISQNKYKETPMIDKKEFLLKENGKPLKTKGENANTAENADQRCFVFITEIHLIKD